MKVEVFSHSFKVTDFTERENKAIERFCSQLIQYEQVLEDGKKVWKATKVFASSNAGRDYYRFHVNTLAVFQRSMGYHQIPPSDIQYEHYDVDITDKMRTEFEVKFLHPPRDNQPEIIKDILAPGYNKIVTLQPGGGKAFLTHTRIKIPGGWTTMGKLEVGDVITAKDGTPTIVTGVYPQGKLQLYKITFEDGRNVECCLEHLWGLIDGSVINTDEMIERLYWNKSVTIPTISSEVGEDKDLDVDPYYFGCVVRNSIPEQYLNASTEQRKALLSGIIKTSGHYDDQTATTLVFTNCKKLALDVQYLARSLGCIASLNDLKTDQSRYQIEIQYSLGLKVVSIEKTTIEEAQCISIDHPERLYVVDDFIATHNTLISMICMSKLNLRTIAFMKGSYTDRWLPDLEKSFNYKKQELLVVRGSASLNAIMEMALDGEFQAKTTLISTTTFSEYIKDFEANGVTHQYPITPEKFFEKMGIGFAILDEAHQTPHQVMKLFTYTNVPKFLSLSATIDTKNAFLDKMYCIMFPRNQRVDGGSYEAFIRVLAIRFQILKPKAIRYTGFGGAYNHNTFEASLMSKKNKQELTNYLDMITWYVEELYVKVMEKGQKMIVFCGTIDFCTLVQKHLQKKFNHLKVVRYVSKDKATVLSEGEIIVSTVLSAGTAVDIPNLRVSLMTTAIDSQQSNEQTKGRTRKLKDFPDVTPLFAYFVCTSIAQHVRYHDNKKVFFSGKCKEHVEEQAPFSL